MRWQKKLTKKEMKHVKESIVGRPTLAAIKSNRKFQREMLDSSGYEPCWACKFIAVKLGIE